MDSPCPKQPWMVWGLVLFLALIAPSHAQPPQSPPSPDNPDVRVLIVPKTETVLSGEIAGRIQSIRADIGDRFKKGEPLVVFDCEMYKAQMKKAQAELAEARKTLEVNRRLDKLGSVSQLEMATSRTRAQRAQAELALRKTQVDKCVIQAPFTGRVVQRKAQPFEYVSSGQPLLEVIDDIHLQLQLFVPSHWLKWLKPGAGFTVHIEETGQEYPAKVTTLGARLDPVSQTLEIRGEVEGEHPELLAGMSGTAHFDLPQ